MNLLKAPLTALQLSSVCEGSLGLSWSLFLLSLSQGFRQMQSLHRCAPQAWRELWPPLPFPLHLDYLHILRCCAPWLLGVSSLEL